MQALIMVSLDHFKEAFTHFVFNAFYLFRITQQEDGH